MSNFLDTLTAVEKALGLTPVEVPENWEDFVKEQEFTPSTFIAFIKEEVSAQSGMDSDTVALHKEYLSEVICLAKFSYDKESGKILIPVAAEFGPMAMRAFRAYQSAARSPMMAEMESSYHGDMEEKEPEMDKGDDILKCSVEELAKALAPALIKLLDGAAEEVPSSDESIEEILEETEEVAKEEEGNIEEVQTEEVSAEPAVEEVVVEEEVAKAEVLGAVQDIVIEGDAPDLGDINNWKL